MLSLEPMGDQGALARFADETSALNWARIVRDAAPPWLVDVVGAYTSVAVFHDPARARLADVMRQLRGLVLAAGAAAIGPLRVLPCCYEMGPDLARVAAHTGLSCEEVVRLHAGAEYTVYAIGFSPGFPYLGYLPSALCGVPRLESPRLRVEAGSVGLTGRQTGVYPEARPGGWALIGRVPLVLVDVAAGYFPLRGGDRVRFAPIDAAEFERLRGRRLE